MAFWGVELKPGNPYTHRFDDALGRLHISNAILGPGSSKRKTWVLCKVGNKCSVFICLLIPDKTESCPLNLEFEEEDDVVFSIIGYHCVTLTGFYLGNKWDSAGLGDEDDRDDTAKTTETDESTDFDTEVEYAEDFIDDINLEAYPSSHVPNSGVVIEEILDDEKLPKKNGINKHPSKKDHLSNSDDSGSFERQIVMKGSAGAPVLESEDKDGLPISSSFNSVPTVQKNEAKVKKKEKGDKKIAEEGKNKRKEDSDQVSGLKRKIDTVQDGDPEGNLPSTLEELSKVTASPKSATKSLNKDESQVEGTPKISSKRKCTPGKEETSETQHGAIAYGENLVGSKIKVYWPKDRMFYEGVIESFDPVKMKHRVSYNDGDAEIMNLRRERWQFIEEEDVAGGQETDLPGSDASFDMHQKKSKTNSDSSTKQKKTDASTAKRGGVVLTRKSKSEATKSGGKSKEDVKHSSKSKEDSPKTVNKFKVPDAIDYGENLVGSKIKVYWPKDRMFYEGVIESFDPVKMKHRVSYIDGNVEIINLRRERWQFIEDPDASSVMHQKKKAKTNSDSSTKQGKTDASAKSAGGVLTSKSKSESTKSGGKSKEDVNHAPITGDQ